MLSESWAELLLILSVTFALAGVVKGVAGLGLPTVAMGVLGTFMAPAMAAAFMVVPALFTNVWQLFAGPSFGRLASKLWLMMLMTALATVASAGVLGGVDPKWSRLTLGLVLVAYACYSLVAPVFTVPDSVQGWLGPVLGVITGLLTGVTGVFAIPSVPYLQALGLDKEELVQALGLSFTVSTIALGVGLSLISGFVVEQMGWSVYAILPAMLGMWLGQILRSRISQQAFRRCFLGCLALLGLDLCIRPLL